MGPDGSIKSRRRERRMIEAMLIAAFVILTLAVALGAVLAVMHIQMKDAAMRRPQFAALHGLLALIGLGCLILALGGPPRGLDQGTASFGIIAATVLALAAVLGGGLLASRIFKGRIGGGLVGIHATFAVSGFVILIAYMLAG